MSCPFTLAQNSNVDNTTQINILANNINSPLYLSRGLHKLWTFHRPTRCFLHSLYVHTTYYVCGCFRNYLQSQRQWRTNEEEVDCDQHFPSQVSTNLSLTNSFLGWLNCDGENGCTVWVIFNEMFSDVESRVNLGSRGGQSWERLHTLLPCNLAVVEVIHNFGARKKV